jgi:triacylglycerol lipase
MITVRDIGAVVADRGYQLRQQIRQLVPNALPAGYSRGALAPVLLLPGVYETWRFLQPIGDRLNVLGHPIHVLPELGHNRLTIAASAALAERYLSDCDLSDVIVIGHSKGGLVAKHMMVTDDVEGRISRLVAINSPFQGSSLARFAPVKTLRAFSPADRTVATLAANLAANHRITSIYSRLDPLIPGGSELAGATNIRLSVVGHFRPLGDAHLLAEVERAIAS